MSLETFLWTPRRSRWRWPLALAAVAASVAHVPVVAPHLAEAPYMGEEFIVLTVACALLAATALIWDSTAVYVLSAATCGLAVIGYAATRLVEFPQLGDDVGNWFEPLGVVSVAAELVVVATAICGLVLPKADRPVAVPDRRRRVPVEMVGARG
ncbi:MAG: hypothetical protein ACR2LX_14090 [Jatrophihabitans sp.]